ncbi:type VI protein secretion system component VasK [Neisseria sp. HSC-16F19]|nr:phage holin family protein [Neisseria sp. HSC-16F19]MCP2040851.1 type VI protein secretion system component VasK [Neisseria sp. HSC-16F19]
MLSQWKQLKIWSEYGSRLLWVRLRMLRLDAVAQLRSIILLVAAVLLATVAFFLGFISLLFGLNSVLTPEAKIWVFFGLAAAFALGVIALLWWVGRLWAQQGHFMEDTLQAMSEDLDHINNRAARPAAPSADANDYSV